MKEEFAIFRTFSSFGQMLEIKDALVSNGIETITADNKAPVDVTFNVGGSLNEKIEIRIKQSDFAKAENI